MKFIIMIVLFVCVREHILESAYRMEEQGERPWQTMLESPIYMDFEGDAESLTHALVMRVEQIYRFMAAVFLLLFLCLCVLLHRRKLTYVAVLMVLAVLPCRLQYVPFCAEYWSPWLLSLILLLWQQGMELRWWFM